MEYGNRGSALWIIHNWNNIDDFVGRYKKLNSLVSQIVKQNFRHGFKI